MGAQIDIFLIKLMSQSFHKLFGLFPSALIVLFLFEHIVTVVVSNRWSANLTNSFSYNLKRKSCRHHPPERWNLTSWLRPWMVHYSTCSVDSGKKLTNLVHHCTVQSFLNHFDFCNLLIIYQITSIITEKVFIFPTWVSYIHVDWYNYSSLVKSSYNDAKVICYSVIGNISKLHGQTVIS